MDGIEKIKILNIYLEEREKNDKMFELIGRMMPNENGKGARKWGSKEKIEQRHRDILIDLIK